VVCSLRVFTDRLRRLRERVAFRRLRERVAFRRDRVKIRRLRELRLRDLICFTINMPSRVIVMLPNTKPTHFWHFCMGEMLPVVEAIINAKVHNRHIYIYFSPHRQNGPLDNLFTSLPGLDISFTSTRPCRQDMILRPQSHGEYGNSLRKGSTWDGGTHGQTRMSKQSRRRVRRIVAWLKRHSRKVTSKNTTIIQSRVVPRSHHNFFNKGTCGNTRTGEYRRKDNFTDNTKSAIVKTGKIPFVYASAMDSFEEQLAVHKNATSMILRHGAGMFWALFLSPGAIVIEVVEQEKKTNWQFDIAKISGLRWIQVDPKHSDCNVSDAILNAHYGRLCKNLMIPNSTGYLSHPRFRLRHQ
jgi:hypothetical protein